MSNMPHISVLKNEWLQILAEQHLNIYVDGTLGAGGHAEAVLENHPEIEKFIGIDQDEQALAIAKARLAPWQNKISYVSGNFSEIDQHLKSLSISKVDAILLDIGVSSMQFDQAERGFSIMNPGPLDMRMNPNQALTAEEIINFWPEEDIGEIIRVYGEEKFWRRIARTIVNTRTHTPISTTDQLVSLLRPLFPSKYQKGIHPLTLTFQALRIAVNRELDVLKEVIPKAIDLLTPKGKLGIISFQSLEDRIVKNAFRWAASDKESTTGFGGVFLDKEPTVNLVTRKALTPSEEEMSINPRSRSAKLRVIEKR